MDKYKQRIRSLFSQKASAVVLIAAVLIGLATVFKAYALVFWGLSIATLILALAIVYKQQLQRNAENLIWVVPLALVVAALGAIGMYFLVLSVNK